MKNADELYVDYLRWCLANKLPPLNPIQHQKVLSGIYPADNNVDKILLQGKERKKDK